MSKSLTIRRPDDWHVHFRDGAMMQAVVPFTAAQFARGIAMPNLVPPVTTAAEANAYRDRILSAVPAGVKFEPLMVAYLTDGIDPAELRKGFETKAWVAAKLYPAKATTNSAHGVTDIKKILPALAEMAKIGMPLLIHGEVTDQDVDLFDREAVFLTEILAPLVEALPDLKIVLEHATTEEAVNFVLSRRKNMGCTITAHHLAFNRNAIFQGGIRPHFYCLPIAKREKHRLALRAAATSGDPRFFLGTDSAPHLAKAKEAACGCAGLFTAPAALEAYIQVFEEEGKLENFEAFASINGPTFYGLPLNEDRITLRSGKRFIAETIPAADQHLVPYLAGESVRWEIA